MLPRNLHASLLATLVVGYVTLIRSVALDRWITVLAALLLIGGAAAALRGRTWGVALSLASAAAFPVAWAVGIAPFWFVGVGLIGALPFMQVSGALARFDRRATATLAWIAATAGALTAVAWKFFALDVFTTYPSLWPSRYPQHGLAVSALAAIGVIAALVQVRRHRREPVRINSVDRVRVGAAVPRVAATSAEAEAEAYEEASAALRRRQ